MKKIFYFAVIALSLSFNSISFSRQKNFNTDARKEANFLDPNQFFQSLTPVNENILKTPSIFSNNELVTPIINPSVIIDLSNSACRNSLENGKTFEDKIQECPSILNSIVWESPLGDPVSFRAWNSEQKSRIDQIYRRIFNEETDLGLSCPVPTRSYHVGVGSHMFLSAQEAFDVYAAHVAFAVYLEATRSVPWTILNLPQIQRTELFNSKSYHVPILENARVTYPSHIRPERDYQLPYRTKEGLVCDPRVGYNFIRGLASTSGENLLGANPTETLAKLTYWLKNNVTHYLTPSEVPYPVTSLAFLEDRLRVRMISGENRIPASEGCHTATNILYDLARSVNIPLLAIVKFDPLSSPDADLTGRIHQGLVAFAESPQVRVLYNMDEIVASDLQMIYPITADGMIMGPDQPAAAQLYFDTQWVSFETLESWGFHTFRGLPWLTTRIAGMGRISPDNVYPNFGRLLGYWDRFSSSGFLPERMYQLEKAYQMCAWNVLNDYCTRRGPDFVENIYNPALVHPAEFLPPVTRSGNDFYIRANQCFAIYGSCEEIASRRRDWESNLASTSFR